MCPGMQEARLRGLLERGLPSGAAQLMTTALRLEGAACASDTLDLS